MSEPVARLFVAIYPPVPAVDDLASVVSELTVGQAAGKGINARLAARPTWHLTVVFLGDVPTARLGEVEAAVGGAVAAWRAPGVPPVVRIAGGGKFGRGRFTVLWAGLAGDVEPLRALSTAARRQLKRARLPCDYKPFRPHVTLARPGDRLDASAIAADVATLQTYEGPQWSVTEVRLVRSHPGPKPSYDRVATFPSIKEKLADESDETP